MQSLTALSLNIQTPNYATVMHAVQNDKLSRKITAYLFDGASPFTPPAGASAMVRYCKPDGTAGLYDTLEDEETAAVTWEGNTATVWLAEQALTAAGNVLCQLQFYTASERLSTFTFIISVQANTVPDAYIESTDYFSILTQRIEAILGAVTYPPSINSSGHWVLFDPDTQQYYDSGVDATGPEGATGPTGPYMASIAKISGTGAAGTTDQYQVTLSDGTHPAGTISVYNGSDGQGSPGSATPLMDGTAAVGSANAYSREDHVHPHDTSKLDASDFVLATATPEMDGTGAVGTSTKVAREDHVHPSDTSKANITEVNALKPTSEVVGNVTVYRLSNYRIIQIDTPAQTMATLPVGDRPPVWVSVPTKVYDGSTYVDCRINVGTDGVVDVRDIWGSVLSGAQYSYLVTRYISYAI